jgi:hypothetical protein
MLAAEISAATFLGAPDLVALHVADLGGDDNIQQNLHIAAERRRMSAVGGS